MVAAGANRGPPVPSHGAPCHGCKCGSLDLKNYSGHEFRTPADKFGYVYMFQMCEQIPNSRLPLGCQAMPGVMKLPHPAVVKYMPGDPADCDMIGSFGPCKEGDCGMTYQAPRNGTPFAVTWRFQYGCENTFRIYLANGHEDMPREVPHHDPADPYGCYWTLHWPSLNAFGLGSPRIGRPQNKSWV